MEIPNKLFSPDRPEDSDFEPKGFVYVVIGRHNKFHTGDPALIPPPESLYRVEIEKIEEEKEEDDYEDDFHE